MVFVISCTRFVPAKTHAAGKKQAKVLVAHAEHPI